MTSNPRIPLIGIKHIILKFKKAISRKSSTTSADAGNRNRPLFSALPSLSERVGITKQAIDGKDYLLREINRRTML